MATEQGRESRRTTTIAKQQSHFKVDAIAECDVSYQRSVEDGEMHMEKLNKKMENERWSKQNGTFTSAILFGIGSEYYIHRRVSSKWFVLVVENLPP